MGRESDNGLALDGLHGDQWSEFAYMVNYLNANLNDTDIIAGTASGDSFWDSWYVVMRSLAENRARRKTHYEGGADDDAVLSRYDGLYFSAAEWKTINGGLNRLPESFHPLVDNYTVMGRKIERVQWDEDSQQVTLQWRNNYTETTFQDSTYDFAVVAVPFSVLKNWRLPDIGLTITNAISNMEYQAACKVALEFETRFWEHYENPIYGSCSTVTDIPGIGSICYPSYNINGSGPATMLGSYVSGNQWGARWASASDEEHMEYVLQAMIEIHGEVAREQFTGKYNRRCWILDPLESASWASPSIGQHQLYLPEYFKTHNNVSGHQHSFQAVSRTLPYIIHAPCRPCHRSTVLANTRLVPMQMIFVGEHTSYTHAWIASALESGIRGSVQLMLGKSSGIMSRMPRISHGRALYSNPESELGLVDEAKATVEKWMARWIEVVSVEFFSRF